MTLEEKAGNNNFFYISPRIIQGGVTLVGSNKALELYESMDDNTTKFAEKEIDNLISSANYNNEEAKKHLNLSLVFCGDFNDIPNDIIGSFSDFIMKNKEKIVAKYRYVKSTEQRNFFVCFPQSETIYNYDYLYLNLAKLLEEFRKNNVKYEVDMTEDRFTPAAYRDDTVTKFVISYSPKKEIESEKGQQLQKVNKEV